MNEDRMQILEMLQAGKINVDEATQLLEAAERPKAADPSPAPRRPSAHDKSLAHDEEETGQSSQPRPAAKSRLPEMVGTYLDGAKLAGAKLEGADLTGAYLGNADLRGADLRDADLTGAYLAGANLRNANLRGATLTGAHLAGADFEEADLAEINLTGAHVPGAKVRDGAFVFEEDGNEESTHMQNRIHEDIVVQ